MTNPPRDGLISTAMNDVPKKVGIITPAHPLEALSLIGIFGGLVLFIYSVLTVYGIPYGVDFGEGYLANMSLELFQGQNPYHPLDNPPWIVSSYPPFYPLINGLLTSLVGQSLLPGRFIATASFIGIIAAAVVLLKRLGVSATISVIAAGFLLVFPWGFRWAQVVRVDTLGIFLSLAGLHWWINSEKTSDGIIAAIIMSAAVLTKHSLLAAPLACLVYAFITRDRRRVMLLLMLAVLIGGSYGLINIITGGGLFLHLFNYTANVWFGGRFAAGIGEYFRMTWILQIVALSAAFMPELTKGRRLILGWYYLFAHLALISYGFEGSDTNYLIEPLLATSLLSALTFDRLTQPKESARPLGKGLPSMRTVGFAIIIAIIILGRYIDSSDYKIHRINDERLQNGLELIRLCAGPRGDVLSEDASFTFLAGKRVIFQPYIMSLLARTGKWDQTEFVGTIENREYALIVLRVDLTDPYNTEVAGGAYEMAGYDRWTEEMETAITENYYLHGGLDVGVGNLWYVYLPRQTPISTQ